MKPKFEVVGVILRATFEDGYVNVDCSPQGVVYKKYKLGTEENVTAASDFVTRYTGEGTPDFQCGDEVMWRRASRRRYLPDTWVRTVVQKATKHRVGIFVNGKMRYVEPRNLKLSNVTRLPRWQMSGSM